MPFAFPPPPAQTTTIKAAVEVAKADLRFNEKLYDHLLAALSRFGFGESGDLALARRFVPEHIAERINPEIQRIVLAPNTDPVTHPFYQEESPNKYHNNIKRYSITLFNARGEFSDDAYTICNRIYNDKTALSLKPTAILNLLHCAFWHECGYLTERAKQAELVKSFTRRVQAN